MTTTSATYAPPGRDAAAERSVAGARRVAWPLVAAVASTCCMIFGWNWDISWHRSVGRDTVWTLPHFAVYIALALAFAYNVWIVLRGTFGAGRDEPGIRVFTFHAPAGAFVTLWAVLLQFTAILFDIWWHGVYGLDNAVFSPPHYALAGALAVFYFGQFLLATSWRNTGRGGSEASTRWVLLLIWSFFLCHIVMVDPCFGPFATVTATYLMSGAVVLPFSLLLIDELLESPWAAVICGAVYMIATIAQMQFFQLFPATPKFGPVFHRVTHFLPPAFPLLLVVPALAVGFTARALRGKRAGAVYSLCGLSFVASFLAANLAMSLILSSQLGANRFFAGNYPGSAFIEGYRGSVPLGLDAGSAARLAIAAALAASSCWMGAATGRWMRTVVR